MVYSVWMRMDRFLRWLGPSWPTTRLAAEVGASLTQVRRWRRGVHVPKGKHAERVRKLQSESQAIFQKELFEDRGVLAARRVEEKLATLPLPPLPAPVDKSDQTRMFDSGG